MCFLTKLTITNTITAILHHFFSSFFLISFFLLFSCVKSLFPQLNYNAIKIKYSTNC
jgi:hypothetical protein